MPRDRFSPDATRAHAEAVAREMWETAQAEEQAEKDGRGLYRKVGLPAMLAGIGADLASTHHVMNRGGREANPVYGKDASFGKVAAINAAITAGIALALDRAAKKHPKAATVAAATIGGVRGAVAARNWSQD